ncbi:hypothetical protein EJB05_55741, partial [Eragrostis curvula]
MPAQPPGWRGPSPAPVRIQARGCDMFRYRCQKDRPEHEPEPELDDYDPKVMAFVDLFPANSEDPFIQELRRYHVAYCAAAGMRVPPDMFRNEKDEISGYMMKISSSRAAIQNVNSKVAALTVCAQAQTALDLASMVMDLTDIASLDVGTPEFSQHTLNQMVRMYTPIFRNVAEDAYRKRIKTDTILSFLDALRGLVTVCHVLVQDTVAMLEDDSSKHRVSKNMLTYSNEYSRKANNLKEVFITAGIKQTVGMDILSDGIKQAHKYICQLVLSRGAALGFLLLEKARKLQDAEKVKRLGDAGFPS